MDLFLNILFLCVLTICFGIYVFNLVLNIIRAVKTNKIVKEDPQTLKATVVEIMKAPKRVYIKVRHKSEANNQTFETVFELTPNEFKDQYYEGQEVEIIYPKVTGTKKINCFPIYLSGQKIGVEAGAIFSDALMASAGLFILLFSLFNMLEAGAFNGGVPLISMLASTDNNYVEPSMQPLTIIIFLIVNVMLLPTLLERLTGISNAHSQNYLKIYGVKTRAEVVTYKFNRSKNEKGVRQSEVKIEFRTKQGEKIETQIFSFMYTEKQEPFVDILYDPRRPQMAVYLRD